MIVPCSTKTNPSAVGAAPVESSDELKAIKAKIMAASKPSMFMDDAVRLEMQKAQVAEATASLAATKKARRRSPGAKLDGGGLQPTAPGSGHDEDPFIKMWDSLCAEGEEINKIHVANLTAKTGIIPIPPIYGSALGDLRVRARYRFWPARKAAQPLLAVSARMHLAVSKAATTSNERVHAPASRINCKLRARMLPDTLSRLTMGHFWVVEEAESLSRDISLFEDGTDFDVYAVDEMINFDVCDLDVNLRAPAMACVHDGVAAAHGIGNAGAGRASVAAAAAAAMDPSAVVVVND